MRLYKRLAAYITRRLTAYNKQESMHSKLVI